MRLRPLKVSAISAPRPSRTKADVSMVGAGQVLRPAPYAENFSAQLGRGLRLSPGWSLLVADAAALLELDGCALVLKLLPDLGGLFLVDAVLDRLAARLDQILGLLQAEAGNGPDLLDDVDLFLATGF